MQSAYSAAGHPNTDIHLWRKEVKKKKKCSYSSSKKFFCILAIWTDIWFQWTLRPHPPLSFSCLKQGVTIHICIAVVICKRGLTETAIQLTRIMELCVAGTATFSSELIHILFFQRVSLVGFSFVYFKCCQATIFYECHPFFPWNEHQHKAMLQLKTHWLKGYISRRLRQLMLEVQVWSQARTH